MASRFSWFLCPLLALLLCHDAALSAKTPQQIDIQTLKSMKWAVHGGGQFAVMHLSGGSLENCHEIQYNDATGVRGDCNFARLFRKQLTGNQEIAEIHKTDVCEGYQLMQANGIIEYHLGSQLPNFQPDCGDEAGRKTPPQPGPSRPKSPK
ncbi:uncharacterized protein LOC134771432 [Penaeus indicus]|uniref:uncharacterized protein LOC134771432 n=1 Tax=Penaeus indicus TaxID=29960 RepID=UPI00300D83EB